MGAEGRAGGKLGDKWLTVFNLRVCVFSFCSFSKPFLPPLLFHYYVFFLSYLNAVVCLLLTFH